MVKIGFFSLSAFTALAQAANPIGPKITETQKLIVNELKNQGYTLTEYFQKLSDDGPIGRNLAVLTTGQWARRGWKDIHQYGCWCNFENFRTGHGPPVDPYDSSCKRLHDNYLCTIEESLAAGETNCNPESDKYEDSMLSGYIAAAAALKIAGQPVEAAAAMQQVYDYCDAQNTFAGIRNVCHSGACKSESRFIYEVNVQINYFFEPENFPKPEYAHFDDNDAAVFDTDSNCRASGGAKSEKVLECCGLVPNAVRYNSRGNANCCNDQNMYNILHQCCSLTAGVKNIGTC